jgi:5-methylcytosine-specific restriction endonuclease McrA
MATIKQRRKHSVPQAKNAMKRAVQEILDPGPRSIDALWDHFGSQCAYCGRVLNRAERDGHVDHAVAGGGNQLGNLVLACRICNGDEKRDEPWTDFLRKKASDPAVFANRKERVLAWFEQNPIVPLPHGPEIDQLGAEIDALITQFGEKCTELRKLTAPNT